MTRNGRATPGKVTPASPPALRYAVRDGFVARKDEKNAEVRSQNEEVKSQPISLAFFAAVLCALFGYKLFSATSAV
jgi:hypothetical protein